MQSSSTYVLGIVYVYSKVRTTACTCKEVVILYNSTDTVATFEGLGMTLSSR